MNARKLAFGLFWSLLFTSPGWGQTSDVVRPPGKNSRSPTIGQTIAISPNQAGGRPAPAAPADTGVVGIVYMEDVKEDAAPVKQDDAKIRERRDAVRYLGTVDCARWPEAADRLVDALVKDASEEIRFEAALALGKGNCCTPSTIHALKITAIATNVDGSPAEKSERVRKAAAEALVRCETGQKEAPKVKDNNNNGEPRKAEEPSLEELRARAAAVHLTYTPRADSVSAIMSQAMGGRGGFIQDVRRQLTGRQQMAPVPAVR